MPSPDLRQALQRHFGFPSFRPGQEEAIRHVLAGHDTLVVMPTGAGKSLCYQLSSLLLPGTTLVVSPLIALMKDQVDALTKARIAATYVNSSLSPTQQRARLRAMAEGVYKLVYVAPERLRSVPFRQALAQAQVSLLAVDEAHCISQWGHDFRPDYLHLRQAIADLGRPPVLASTATATRQVQADIVAQLGLTDARRVVTGFNRPNLAFIVRYTPDPVAKLRQLRALLTETDGSVIVYTGTRREAEEVADFVNEVVGKRAEHYHAGLEAEARTRVQEAFMADQVPIVVATNAFGMGVDKPDVRAVVHYNLPSTVEAYYQEAGRAGRDGQPAQCTLLYSPEDRALQEWFIANDAPTLDELRQLYAVIQAAAGQGITWLTSEDLQRATGLHEVKVRVGISQLERIGALSRLGDHVGQMGLELSPVEELSLEETAAEVEARREHKRRLLGQMVTYAETDACRRQYILDYFGDPGTPQTERCCDNCLARVPTPARRRKAESEAEWIPLIILETIRTLRWETGRVKLAQLLKGSRAKSMIQFGYDKHKFYGKLPQFTLKQLQGLIDQLVGQGYLKTVGGEYPVLRLTPQGAAALKARAAIELTVPRVEKRRSRANVEGERKFSTVGYTHQLMQAGMGLEQIAQERGLALSTVYTHVSKLIEQGLVDVDDVVPRQVQDRIRAVTAQVGTESLSAIKERLPEDISYEQIRCVVADEKRLFAQTAVQIAQVTEDAEMADAVERFLHQARPRPLQGPWRLGYALDFHSRFQGARWERSEMGEMAYRFKYQGDRSLGRVLAERLARLMAEHPELRQVDGIVPVPPSLRDRPYDPVDFLADLLARQTGVPVLKGKLIKTRQTRPQKEMANLAQKRANVAGAFRVRDDPSGLSPSELALSKAKGRSLRGKRLLVLDDLYDSGATLEEVTRVLLAAGARSVCVLTLTKTIHTD